MTASWKVDSKCGHPDPTRSQCSGPGLQSSLRCGSCSIAVTDCASSRKTLTALHRHCARPNRQALEPVVLWLSSGTPTCRRTILPNSIHHPSFIDAFSDPIRSGIRNPSAAFADHRCFFHRRYNNEQMRERGSLRRHVFSLNL
jgi:hypothetical protein